MFSVYIAGCDIYVFVYIVAVIATLIVWCQAKCIAAEVDTFSGGRPRRVSPLPEEMAHQAALTEYNRE